MGKKVVSLFLLVFLIGLASAVSPFQTGANQNEGIQLFTLQFDAFKVNTPFTSHLHATNISTGKELLNSEYECYLHLYNSTGNHILVVNYSNDSDNIEDKQLFIAAGNFSEVGQYGFRISCSTDEIGGDVAGVILVNYSGILLSVSEAILYIGFLGLLIFAFFLNFVGMGYLPARNTTDEEGRIMSVSYLKYFRNVLWMSGYFLFIGIFYIASNLAFTFLQEELVAKALFMIFQIALIVSPVIIIVWVLYIFSSMFHDKEFQKILNRGMFPQKI